MKRFKKPSFKPKQRINSITASWNLAKITKYFLIIAVVLLLVTVWVWYTRIYMTNERRFWSAVENSMSTPSVVRTLTEGGSGNQVVQDYRFYYSPQQVIENKVVFTQRSATIDTGVTTRGIIFPTEQFLSYTEFFTRENGEETANLDEVLNKWAIQTSDNEEESRQNYLSEYVTLAIFGNFRAEDRNFLVNELKSRNAYNVDFNNALDDNIDGEKVKRYSVSVDLRSFVTILNESFVRAGYGDFPPLNPENYREGSSLNANFTVRSRDNTIIGIAFGNRDERYSNYGVIETVEAPEADLTIDELQNIVQEQLQ